MKTKEEYLLALDRIDNAYNNFDRSISAVGMFIQDFNLLLGLVNEHFEEKQKTKEETNFEHFFEYLSTKRMSDFALIDGRVTKCLGTDCSECDFNGDCIEGKFKWLKQPYEKTTFKLTQFEYDLLNAYKNSGMRQCISNYGTLLEMYGKGHFKGIDTSTPIHEILDNCEVTE